MLFMIIERFNRLLKKSRGSRRRRRGSLEITPASPPLLASCKIASHRDLRDLFNTLLRIKTPSLFIMRCGREVGNCLTVCDTSTAGLSRTSLAVLS